MTPSEGQQAPVERAATGDCATVSESVWKATALDRYDPVDGISKRAEDLSWIITSRSIWWKESGHPLPSPHGEHLYDAGCAICKAGAAPWALRVVIDAVLNADYSEVAEPVTAGCNGMDHCDGLPCTSPARYSVSFRRRPPMLACGRHLNKVIERWHLFDRTIEVRCL